MTSSFQCHDWIIFTSVNSETLRSLSLVDKPSTLTASDGTRSHHSNVLDPTDIVGELTENDDFTVNFGARIITQKHYGIPQNVRLTSYGLAVLYVHLLYGAFEHIM
jgi:hypothetical protein